MGVVQICHLEITLSGSYDGTPSSIKQGSNTIIEARGGGAGGGGPVPNEMMTSRYGASGGGGGGWAINVGTTSGKQWNN